MRLNSRNNPQDFTGYIQSIITSKPKAQAAIIKLIKQDKDLLAKFKQKFSELIEASPDDSSVNKAQLKEQAANF